MLHVSHVFLFFLCLCVLKEIHPREALAEEQAGHVSVRKVSELSTTTSLQLGCLKKRERERESICLCRLVQLCSLYKKVSFWYLCSL